VGSTEAGRLLQIGYRQEENKVYFVFHAIPRESMRKLLMVNIFGKDEHLKTLGKGS
jgi:hypothetical protein